MCQAGFFFFTASARWRMLVDLAVESKPNSSIDDDWSGLSRTSFHESVGACPRVLQDSNHFCVARAALRLSFQYFQSSLARNWRM